MKIKRFVASDMRTAFRMVRDEQGPNAVILSSRRVDNNVEVIAATDYDEALVQQAIKLVGKTSAQPESEETPSVKVSAPPPPPALIEVNHVAEESSLREVRSEINSMRHLIEREISKLTNDRLRASPIRALMLDELQDFGCEAELAASIVSCLPNDIELRKARGQVLGLWAKSITTPKNDLMIEGGVFAFIGPTGAGKTTTIAKLAARYIRRYGPRDIALVTIDTQRVAAREQLYLYGRLLGVPVFEAGNAERLADTLARLADYKLVLIDTAGMSQRDSGLATQLGWLESIRDLRSLLVLPANAQSTDLDDVVRRYWSARPEAVVLTKVDETAKLGVSLSVAIRHQLPVAYMTDGQRVPEDIQLAQSHRLVLRASELRAQSKRDEAVAGKAHVAA
jgi:flagellar biosynthesis protein FlhF